jgi:hypothetical protein
MRIARIPGAGVSIQEHTEHLSADVLWATVKKRQPLAKAYVEHTKDCRDCREFVWEFLMEARGAGLSLPDLLPQTDRPQSN